MKKKEQPAQVSYFFGPGWFDLTYFIEQFWGYNKEDIRDRLDNLDREKGIMSFSGAFNIFICMALMLFGTTFFVAITCVVSVVLGIAFLIAYIFILLIWLIDRLFLLKNRVFVACPNCKNKYLIPTYICPSCGREHTRLTPGKYGVFKRKCECGQKIPTHVFTHREKLDAKCPICEHRLSGTGSRPLCVPIVGGRSAGKTAYITAFLYDFIEKVAPRNGLEITHYSKETEEFYKTEIVNDYLNGTTRMTKTEMDLKQASSKAFSFMVNHKKLNPERLVQIYDIAGESFVDNTENEEQLQYTYCHGVIFMLDPLSMITVRNHLDERVNAVDRASVGTLDVDIVLDAFMNKLRQITGNSSDAVFDMPIAVVISKSDIKTLDQFIGDEKISDYMTEKGLDMEAYSVVEDRLCRQFLMENGLAGFVSNIEMKFKHSRYFKCSSIGHTREAGRYNPKGVLEPMEWIFQMADGGMKNVWHEHQFGTVMRGEEEK